VEKELEAILTAIREAKLDKAQKLVAELRGEIGETPDLAAAGAKIARAELLLAGNEKQKPRKLATTKRRVRP
jgi:hypothetical protein